MTGTRTLWAGGMVLLAVGLWRMDAAPMRLLEGLGKLGWLLVLMVPPSSGGVLRELLEALLATIAMAFLGTFAAALVSLPLAFLGAANVMPLRLLRLGLRRGWDGLRGVDTLVWALIFVSAIGLGPFAGVLAIAVPDTGALSKLFSEAIEAADRREVEAVRAAGGSRLQVVRFGILPQVAPVLLSQVLYFFESNVRSASILGIVGAGGIGLALSDRLRLYNWDEVAFIVLLILVMVGIIDTASRAIRRRLA